MKKNFIIYRSSAGSGKTYALVRNYIRIALTGSDKGFYSNYYRHILAITFTNKAASEMKARIVSSLEDLKEGVGDGVKGSFFTHVKEDTSLDSSLIKSRSSQIFNKVLHKYSDLSICTIDKFVYRIVRTFSHDLYFDQNFDVEMDANKLIQPVVALLLDKVGREDQLSKALVQFSLSKIDEGKSYNLEYDLEDFAKHLFIEKHQTHINSLQNMKVSDCLNLRNDLKKQIHVFEKKLLSYVTSFENFVFKKGLNKKSFYRGYFYNYILSLKSMNLNKFFPNQSLEDNIKNDIWYSKSTSVSEKDVIQKNKLFLMRVYTDIQLHIHKEFKKYLFQKLVIENIYSVAVLNQMVNELKNYKKDNNIRHISEFNHAISSIIRNEHTPFIYERLGEKYKHFLIDEFQDTSVMQWHNLLPLVHNSLSNGYENLIVGDSKQSIYRWRGGEVEQFVNLPDQIFKGELLPNHLELKQSIKSNSKHVQLTDNWRSAKQIVDFNNDFFLFLKEKLSENLKSIYSDHVQQVKSENQGYLFIDFTEKSGQTKDDIMSKVILEIQKLNNNNHPYRDMAVLCRTRKDVSLVAYHLNQVGIKVVSDEAMLISGSREVNFILSLLRFVSNPNCKVSISLILSYIYYNTNKINNLHDLLKSLKDDDFIRYFIDLLFFNGYDLQLDSLLKLPIYDLVERLIKIFQLPSQDIYLQFFLDVILKFSFKNGNDIEDFLEWWQSSHHNESIVLPDGLDAVKVMTVHKSKGLEFPIVFIPFDWNIGKGSTELWVDPQGQLNKMKIALISNSKKIENTVYSDERKLEQEKAFLDDINVLYVALTRASNQLYVFTQNASGDSDLNTLGKIFNYYFKQKGYSLSYSSGRVPDPLIMQNAKSQDLLKLKYEAINDWRSIVQLKNNSSKMWNVDLDKQEWGTMLHESLSQIHYLGDEKKVLEDLHRNGLIIKSQKTQLFNRITELLNHPDILPFFDKKWEVLTEKEILTPSGSSYIPDRLLIDSTQIQIIDYKTGSKDQHLKHCSQINEYAMLLKDMGYTIIKKFIIYTEDDNKVISI